MIRKRAYDVSELGLTYLLRAVDGIDNPPFVAIPVFPNRCFRHSAIYINKASGINRPEDLADRTIGELAIYGHDAGVMPKGILSDEFGFKPESCRRIIGAIDFPMEPIDFIPQPHPHNVAVTMAPRGVDLGDMLASGEIDALISADVPKCVLEGSPNVGRLFEDFEAIERDYFRRTGIFPIMHTVVVTRELAEREPAIVRAIYKGFCDSKNTIAEQLVRGMTFNNMAIMVAHSPARGRPCTARTRLVALRHQQQSCRDRCRAALPLRARADYASLFDRRYLRALSARYLGLSEPRSPPACSSGRSASHSICAIDAAQSTLRKRSGCRGLCQCSPAAQGAPRFAGAVRSQTSRSGRHSVSTRRTCYLRGLTR